MAISPHMLEKQPISMVYNAVVMMVVVMRTRDDLIGDNEGVAL